MRIVSKHYKIYPTPILLNKADSQLYLNSSDKRCGNNWDTAGTINAEKCCD